jgi:hypothetical protein
MKKIFYILIILSISCSKQRIEKPITPNPITSEPQLFKFIPLDNYFITKQNIPSENIKSFDGGTINSSSFGTMFISAHTVAFPDSVNLIYPDDYPITCNLLELYRIKNFIYYNTQPISNNKLLSPLVIFNIHLFKNDKELIISKLEPGIELRKDIGEENVYYNVFLNYPTSNNWISSNFYHTNDGSNTTFIKTGWALIGNPLEFPTTNYTKLKFTSDKYDLTNVGIYVVFSDKNTFTRVENLESIDLPVGEQAKLVAFGITNEGQLYSYSKIITIGEQTSYDINLFKTTEQNLTILLDSL